LLSLVFRHPVSIPLIPNAVILFIAYVVEGILWLTNRVISHPFFILNLSSAKHLMCDTIFDCSAAVRHLGYKPIPTRDALKKIAEEVRSKSQKYD
jgi:nucleoside-diphosphate-sugar epimerase